MEESQRVGFETVLSLLQLSASRRRLRVRWSLNAVERRTACKAEGELSWDRRCEIVEVLFVLSRTSKPSSSWMSQPCREKSLPVHWYGD